MILCTMIINTEAKLSVLYYHVHDNIVNTVIIVRFTGHVLFVTSMKSFHNISTS